MLNSRREIRPKTWIIVVEKNEFKSLKLKIFEENIV